MIDTFSLSRSVLSHWYLTIVENNLFLFSFTMVLIFIVHMYDILLYIYVACDEIDTFSISHLFQNHTCYLTIYDRNFYFCAHL